MTIFVKIKNKKLIINIFALILIYFFSFHFYPKKFGYNKFDYKNIRTNTLNTFINTSREQILNKGISLDLESLRKQKNTFLLGYMEYLKKNPDIVTDAPCPNELKANNLRNVQIYIDDDIYLFNNIEKFNVRFSFYKSFKNSDKLEINKCFDYIFKENLNKYYLLYRNTQIENNYI